MTYTKTKAWAAASAVFCGLIGAVGFDAQAGSVVRFDTALGTFDVQLFDDDAPLHVANFLEYVEAGDYDNSVVHRSARSGDGSPFVVQGGLATFEGTPVTDPGSLPTIPTRGTVLNEPGISNTRGTLALARVGGQVNSGTSQWFINLDDNSALDTVDEGFTVFGEVVGNGLDVVDAIAALPTANLGGPFNETPLRNIDTFAEFQAIQGTPANPGPGFGEEELVIINSISLLAAAMPSQPMEDPPEPEGGQAAGDAPGGNDAADDSSNGADGAADEPGSGGDGAIEIPDVMVPGEDAEPDLGSGLDVVPGEAEEPVFVDDQIDGAPSDSAGRDNGSGTAEVVPTPGAFVGGVLGLTLLAVRRGGGAR